MARSTALVLCAAVNSVTGFSLYLPNPGLGAWHPARCYSALRCSPRDYCGRVGPSGRGRTWRKNRIFLAPQTQGPSARRLAHAGHGHKVRLKMNAWEGVGPGAPVEEAPASAVPVISTANGGGQEFGLGLAPVQTFFPQADRIVAIGDIHGDEGALIACLRMSNCIDADENWCGGTTNVVQIGDILDRGDEERGCMDRLFNLKQQAASAGGAVHILMGNHEAMNVDWDFDYVGLGGFDGWESREQHHTNIASGSFLSNILGGLSQGLQMGGVPGILKDRAKAFTVGTGFAALALSEMPLAIQLGDTVCVHGGLELKHLDRDLHQLNVEVSDWLRGVGPRPSTIDQEDSPIWNRAFSAPADRPLKAFNARKLEHVLHAMGARRMIVGHTPQVGGVNCFLTESGYEVWRTDTGMSRWVKNGPLECLEILADGTSRILTQTSVVPGAARRIDEQATAHLPPKRANSGAGERGYNKGAAPV